VVRALIHEYGFSPEDMDLDLSIGGRKKVDVAIFHHGKEHTIENLGRAVICRQEPNVGKNTVRIRDYEQAATDLGELETIMREVDAVQYGLWTNGLEFFFVEKEQKRFEIKCNPIGDWPMAEESVGTKDVISDAHIRVADAEMLKITFRRCHNFIHGNEGMPKDAAFWQFLYLIFCKMHDENLRAKQRQAWQRRFWAGPKEQFEAQGRKAIRVRIEELFAEVKKKYKNIFRGNEEIALSDRALAFIVSELAKYDFTRTDVDAKGVAYQELVGVNLRGDRGQYFTPRGVVKLVVEMLDPKESETLLDPACGTGGFLVATLGYMLKEFRREQKTQPGNENTSEFLNVHERLREYAAANVFGADFDPFLIRAAQMNMVLAGDGRGHIYNINSLEFPLGHLADLVSAKKEIPLGSVDIIATNPPFGSDIPITDEHILKQYELAHNWEQDGEGGFRNTGVPKGSVAPEVLFIERCIKWLKPGKGRMGIQRNYRVIVAGPTTLWSILNSLQMGFRTLAIEKRTSEVWNLLAGVKTEWTKYGDVLDVVQKKLNQASDTIEKAKTRSRAIGRKLKDVQELPALEATALLSPTLLADEGEPNEQDALEEETEE